MIPLRRNVTSFRRDFAHHIHRGGREAAVAALGLFVLKAFCATAFLPASGFLAGYCFVHLALKVATYYNFPIKTDETLLFQTFQQYPKLKVIILVFAVLVAGAYPYISLMLSALAGAAIGAELLSTREVDSKECWLKKVWTSLL